MQALAEAFPRTLLVFAFVFGAVVGSFLNVVIARVPKGLSVVRPASRCPRCLAPIAWYDNLPILSWLLLRARCRGCGLPISARYPTVELISGLLALSLLKRFGPTPAALAFFALAAALVALAYIDLDTWLLPHEITWPLIGSGLLSPLWNDELGFRSSAAGAVCGFAVFAAIILFGEKVMKRELMGWGDAFLLGGIGAWTGLGALLPVILLASVQGAVVGAILLAVRGKPAEAGAAPRAQLDAPPPADAGAARPAGEGGLDDDWTPPSHAVPFGPFLALAALEQVLFGDALAALWIRLIGVGN